MRSAAKSWARLQCLERVRRVRQYAGKEASESTSYTASNLPAHMPAHSIRAHWQVENALHCSLHVSSRAGWDLQYLGEGHGTEGFNAIALARARLLQN